jgi:hypothetical protein
MALPHSRSAHAEREALPGSRTARAMEGCETGLR